MSTSTEFSGIPQVGLRPLVESLPPVVDPEPVDQPDEPSDLDDEIPEPDAIPETNEADWDVFVADDDQRDPLPEPGDFYDEDTGFGIHDFGNQDA
jgi:hypothetical protein